MSKPCCVSGRVRDTSCKWDGAPLNSGTSQLRLIAAISVAMILCFAAGVYASRRIIVSPKPSTIQAYVENKGNASAEVRSGVLRAMNDFQGGYTRRDPAQLEAFMRTVFPSEGNIRVIGSEVNEWKNGPAAVSQLVKTDWQYLGKFEARYR